jgi:hypothetical protein
MNTVSLICWQVSRSAVCKEDIMCLELIRNCYRENGKILTRQRGQRGKANILWVS